MPYSVYETSIEIFKKLAKFEDEDIFDEVVMGFSLLSNGENKRIEAVINSGLVPKLISALNSKQSQIKALKTVANIASGDPCQAQVLFDLNILGHLNMLGSSKIKIIRKEVAYTISNLVGGTSPQVSAIVNHPVAQRAMKLLVDKDFEVKRESSYIFANISKTADDPDILNLVEQGVFLFFSEALTVQDPRIILNLLEFVKRSLKSGRLQAGSSSPELNPVIGPLEFSKCTEIITILTAHMNDSIRNLAFYILETFFEEPSQFLISFDPPKTFEFS